MLRYIGVDVVDMVWGFGTTIVGKVKDGIKKFTAGIKDGMSFIGNAAIGPILDAYISIGNNAFHAFGKIMEFILPNSQFTYLEDGVVMDNDKFGFRRNNYDLIITAGEIELNFGNILKLEAQGDETLGASENSIIANLVIKLAISTSQIAAFKPGGGMKALGAYIVSSITLLLYRLLDMALINGGIISDIGTYKSKMRQFHNDAAMSHWFSLLNYFFSKIYAWVLKQVSAQFLKTAVTGAMATTSGVSTSQVMMIKGSTWVIENRDDIIKFAPMLSNLIGASSQIASKDNFRNGYNISLYLLQIIEFGFAYKTKNVKRDDAMDIFSDIFLFATHLFISSSYK